LPISSILAHRIAFFRLKNFIMRWNRYPLWVLAFIVCGLTSTAQDIHFSQFYASPLTLNPALTGLNNCNYRLNLNYRDQWSSVLAKGFKTVAFSYDQNVLREKFGSDFIGAGFAVFQDQSGDAAYTFTNVMGSLSYHRSIGAAARQHVGIGVQVSYTQERLDPTVLIFPDQLLLGRFLNTNPTDEPPFNSNDSYIDIEAGAVWYGEINDRMSGYGGVAMYHINQPGRSFLQNDVPLPSRMVVHGGVKIIQGVNLNIVPNFLFMTQAKAKELIVGGSVEYNIPDNITPEAYASLGAWLRVNGKDPDFSNRITESIIVGFGLGYQNVGFGVSYDINISNLNAASNFRGGFEIALTYTGCFSFSSSPKEIVIPCPRL